MNKCLTILLNLLIWDQHAKPGGIVSLMVCIAGGIIYQQAPMRGEKAAVEAAKPSPDEEAQSDETAKLIEPADKGGAAAKRRG